MRTDRPARPASRPTPPRRLVGVTRGGRRGRRTRRHGPAPIAAPDEAGYRVWAQAGSRAPDDGRRPRPAGTAVQPSGSMCAELPRIRAGLHLACTPVDHRLVRRHGEDPIRISASDPPATLLPARAGRPVSLPAGTPTRSAPRRPGRRRESWRSGGDSAAEPRRRARGVDPRATGAMNRPSQIRLDQTDPGLAAIHQVSEQLAQVLRRIVAPPPVDDVTPKSQLHRHGQGGRGGTAAEGRDGRALARLRQRASRLRRSGRSSAIFLPRA